jgi:tripartite-type tricarboxylate transporter receptor subunit TctC
MKLLKTIFALLMCVTATVNAQTFEPKQPIEIVIGFAPGGAAYQVAQLLANVFKDNNWTSIIVSKPGNSTAIAGNYVAKARPDGLTVYVAGGSSLSSNIVWPPTGTEYNENSFVPVVMLNQSALGLVVNSKSAIKNYEDLKSFIRANPEKFNVGFYNVNMANLFVLWAQKENLPKPTIVLYKGSTPMIVDVVGGSLSMAFDNFGWGAPMLPLIEENQLRVIATFSNSASTQVAKLSSKYPITDIGVLHPELKTSVWMGLAVPAGTPKYIVTALNQAVNRASRDSEYQKQLADMGTFGGSGDVMAQFIRRDIKLFRTVSLLEKNTP